MAGKKDEHVIEAIGRRRILINNGEITGMGESRIRDCPLARKFGYPVPDLSEESVRANIGHRIREFGMCTPRREVLDTREYVGFGASEILSSGIRCGMLDAVVTVCDGAGTIIAPEPALVQGTGGRMSGLIATCPYPEVMDRIERAGGYVLDRDNATLDQVAGVALARDQGFRKIAVTVARAGDAGIIRRIHPETVIFGVHLTGLSRAEAETLVRTSDIVTSCASRAVRDVAGRHALLQAGVSVPVFAMTPAGKNLILEKIRRSPEPVLVRATGLPLLSGQQPEPVV